MFRGFLDDAVRFSGVELMTFCILPRQFTVLVRVPAPPSEPLPDGELIQRLRIIRNEREVERIRRKLAAARSAGDEAMVVTVRGKIERRMCNLWGFIKVVKQRMSSWYNSRVGRRGALWEERFQSAIVEMGNASWAVARAIDLAPFRAGIVDDPAS